MSALYIMEYQGTGGSLGAGVLYIGRGRILGTDIGRSRYEGTYVERDGRVLAKARITAGRNSGFLVTGVTLPPGQSLPIEADWPLDFADGAIQSVKVDGATVHVSLEKIGDIP
ncbi:MAG: hypothetical protein OXI15_07225 [Chromatiales bacterium]|nr:hypothetical protein [Chromatiales bacterium]